MAYQKQNHHPALKAYFIRPQAEAPYLIAETYVNHIGTLTAAEIRYHVIFLTKLAKIRLPLAGSPYASAVRADMSIGDKEFQGLAPYYNLSGKIVCV